MNHKVFIVLLLLLDTGLSFLLRDWVSVALTPLVLVWYLDEISKRS